MCNGFRSFLSVPFLIRGQHEHTLHYSHHTCMMYVTIAARRRKDIDMSAFAPASTTGVPETEIDHDRLPKSWRLSFQAETGDSEAGGKRAGGCGIGVYSSCLSVRAWLDLLLAAWREVWRQVGRCTLVAVGFLRVLLADRRST